MRFFPIRLGLAACFVCFGQDFTVQSPDGSPRRFSDLRGDTTVVVFLAARCPVSNAYTGRLEEVYKDYSPKGVKFIFVNANQNEPAAEVLEHAKRAGFPFTVYRDVGNAAADRFGAQVTPETYLIDRSGAIRYRGAIDDSQNPARVHKQGLRLALDAVLAGKDVPNPETKVFGCTIKRARRMIPLDESEFNHLIQSQPGKILLVDFWATWCEPCREELPKLADLQRRLGSNGLVLITISADEPDKARETAAFLEKSGVSFPAYIKQVADDQRFIDSIDPKWSGALPALFLYDRQGRKVESFIGETEMKDVETAVRHLQEHSQAQAN